MCTVSTSVCEGREHVTCRRASVGPREADAPVHETSEDEGRSLTGGGGARQHPHAPETMSSFLKGNFPY